MAIRPDAIFERNRASAEQLQAHLQAADASFEPALSKRVDLRAYADKLHSRAQRFEAWAGGELVGLVAAYCDAASASGAGQQQAERLAFISNVSVLPAWQGAGLGRSLMQRCLVFSLELGLAGAELEVDPQARPALGLYRSLGFLPALQPGPAISGPLRLRCLFGASAKVLHASA